MALVYPDFTIMQQSHGLFAIAKLLVWTCTDPTYTSRKLRAQKQRVAVAAATSTHLMRHYLVPTRKHSWSIRQAESIRIDSTSVSNTGIFDSVVIE